MKRNLTGLVCLLLPMLLQAQRVSVWSSDDNKKNIVIDKVNYEVVYEMTEVTDTARAHRTHFKEQMMLQVGQKCSAFFSYPAFQVDSMVAAMMARGDRNISIKTTSQVSWSVICNYPDAGRSVYLDKVANDRYRVVEELGVPEWEMIGDSTKQLLGYDCRLARARYRGRTWYAWYTDDVPLPNGPWKLHGLPGLILEAYDSGRDFVFTASALRSAGPGKDLVYKGSDNEEVTRPALNKIYRSYYADAIGYLLMSYPVNQRSSIKITDRDGNELKHSKPQAYNLIEP